jgi:hypothetical protein
MLTSRRIGRAVLTALMALAVPQSLPAQDADTAEVLRYTLTDTALAKYTDATKRLAALPGGGSADCDDDDDEADAKSLAEMAARLDAAPGAKAAVQSAGMTSREYVLFSLALLHNGLAAWAVSQPGGKLPPGVSKANVDFLKTHDKELKQLEALKATDTCDTDE